MKITINTEDTIKDLENYSFMLKDQIKSEQEYLDNQDDVDFEYANDIDSYCYELETERFKVDSLIRQLKYAKINGNRSVEIETDTLDFWEDFINWMERG